MDGNVMISQKNNVNIARNCIETLALASRNYSEVFWNGGTTKALYPI